MRTKGIYFILDGREPKEVNDILEWARWIEKNENKVIKQTNLPNNILVSTVFLGINHAFMDGPPILFETMIFGGEHNQYQNRYATYEEAEKGHEEAIQLVFS